MVLLKQPRVYLPIVFLLIIVVATYAFVFLNRSQISSRLLAPQTPSSAPIKQIPSGKQVYNVSTGAKVAGPKIQQVTLDPQTPAADQSQTVTMTITNDTPITEGIVTLQTDTKEQIRVLKLISGTKTDGTWQVTWKFADTYDRNYAILFDIKSPSGEYKNGMRLR
jgi:hypothetical protein